MVRPVENRIAEVGGVEVALLMRPHHPVFRVPNLKRESVNTGSPGQGIVFARRSRVDRRRCRHEGALASGRVGLASLGAGGYDLSPEDAYMLCSLTVDLKISEIVDAGEYVVSALLPLAIFD